MPTPPASHLDRRTALQLLAFHALAGPAAFHSVRAAAADEKGYEPLNRFPRMVQEYFVAEVRRIEREGNQRRAALESREDAEAYVREVREKIRQCFGDEPERTPLDPRITATVERDGYRIENVIFESRPGFPVTANLYIPTGRSQPMPAVVGTCGHSDNGKAAEAYQSFAQGLARQGYVCLIYDPIGQGERLQYVDEQLKPTVRAGTRQHIMAGNQQFLVGEFFGMWRAWDGMRALDYLLTREEVDPDQIGVTGNSGGGTMTTWLCGVEPRWAMAAPSCFVTTFRRNLENELPADTEQCPPKALALGLDHADFLAAMAPKPVIVLGKERDFFDVRGTQEAYRRLQRLYELLGAEQNVALYVGPTYHGYSQENREAMYRWFNRVTEASDAQREPDLVIEQDEVLWCTPRGQVAELGARTIADFTREKSQQLRESRTTLEDDALRKSVQRVLNMPPRKRAPGFRVLRYLRSRDYPAPHAIAYAVETEPRIQALVYRLSDEPLHSRPPRGSGRAILYVSHLSSDVELRDEPLVRDLIQAEADVPLFTCDVRGIGESLPQTCGIDSFHDPYGCDYFYAIHSLMLDRPYLGQKTYDVLRVLDWLHAVGHRDIHLAGKGWGALAAAFAGLLSDDVGQVTLKHPLQSYAAVAEDPEYQLPLSAMLPDVLRHFDLPDCYGALQSKKLRMIEPWNSRSEPVTG